jgi:phenylalanyl-tRNA synthetase beta chain
MLAGLLTGESLPEQWGEAGRRADFFDLKGDLEALLAQTGCPEAFAFVPEAHPSLHPGQSARVRRDGRNVGWIGMIHPEIEAKLDLAGHTYVLEIHLDEVLTGALPAFEPLSKFPSIRRDIAIVVDREVIFSEVERVIEGAAPKILKEIVLFDVYTGEKIDSGLKSLALGLILQETSHTLTDQEVEEVVQRILQALTDQLQANLRD